MSSISPIEPSLTSKALNAVEQALQARLEAMWRISSGSKISTAKDAPAGAGVSVNLSARGARLEADRLSLQNAANFLQSQASAISQIADVFTEIQSLTLAITQGLSQADSFLTGQQGPTRYTRQDNSELVQQFFSKCDTLWAVANQTFGGVNLFKMEDAGGDGVSGLILADGTTVNVTKFDLAPNRERVSSHGQDMFDLLSLVRITDPRGTGTMTLADWIGNAISTDPAKRDRSKSIEAAVSSMIVRNGAEMLAVQDAADRTASYSVGNAVSLGNIADSNLAEDMSAYASSNIRLFASMAMMAQSKVRPTMAFSLITAA